MLLIDDGAPRPTSSEPGPIDPNWPLIRWLAAAALFVFAGAHAHGFVAYLLLCATVYAVCRAIAGVFDYSDGLREWRQ